MFRDHCYGEMCIENKEWLGGIRKSMFDAVKDSRDREHEEVEETGFLTSMHIWFSDERQKMSLFYRISSCVIIDLSINGRCYLMAEKYKALTVFLLRMDNEDVGDWIIVHVNDGMPE